MSGDLWLREEKVARADMVLLEGLHWGGVMLDIIWRPDAYVPALEIGLLNFFGLSIAQLHRLKVSVHYIY